MTRKTRNTQYVTKYKLTPKELEVLKLLAQGLTCKEIRQKLLLSASTVSTHKINIFSKLNCKGSSATTQAVIKYLTEIAPVSIDLNSLAQEIDAEMEFYYKEKKHLQNLLTACQKENARLQKQNKELQKERIGVANV